MGRLTPAEKVEAKLAHNKAHERRMAVQEQYGSDDWADGTVLRFYKMFSEGSGLYSYVAIKAQGFWYVGGLDEPVLWTQLIDFIEEDNVLGPECIYVATEYEQVYEVEEL